MRAIPEFAVLMGVGVMDLLLAFGLAAVRTKPEPELPLALEAVHDVSQAASS